MSCTMKSRGLQSACARFGQMHVLIRMSATRLMAGNLTITLSSWKAKRHAQFLVDQYSFAPLSRVNNKPEVVVNNSVLTCAAAQILEKLMQDLKIHKGGRLLR